MATALGNTIPCRSLKKRLTGFEFQPRQQPPLAHFSCHSTDGAAAFTPSQVGIERITITTVTETPPAGPSSTSPGSLRRSCGCRLILGSTSCGRSRYEYTAYDEFESSGRSDFCCGVYNDNP